MIVVTTFGLAGILVGGAVPASASPASLAAKPSVPMSSGLVPVFNPTTGVASMATPQSAAAIIAAYWTPARKASAKPVPMDAGPATPDKTPLGTPHNVVNPTTPASGQIHPDVAFTNTDGKVFFHDPVDGNNYVCSGGAINSGKKRLVLTAGHCVHRGGGGQWMQNWVFDPGYQFGVGSPGTFPAFQLWAQSSWINNNDHHFDYAFVITQNGSGGGRLVDTVGGNGLTINPGRPFITFIGYPDNVSNTEQQANCQGQLSRRNIFNSDQQLNCNLGGGSSGGPWLQNYSDANGLGFAVSNTSYGINPDPQGPVFGPYYDGDTQSLFNSADNASP
jgi:V8-like Glu-specific endopeptidase